jgi:obg-like ATPase 1
MFPQRTILSVPLNLMKPGNSDFRFFSNTVRVSVPDDRYEWLVDHWKPASKIPACLQITDIAGLIRGASTGEGLGNAFLSHIRAVDGIFHVCRKFKFDFCI